MKLFLFGQKIHFEHHNYSISLKFSNILPIQAILFTLVHFNAFVNVRKCTLAFVNFPRNYNLVKNVR